MRSAAIDHLRRRLIDLYREPYFTTAQCDEVNTILDAIKEHQHMGTKPVKGKVETDAKGKVTFKVTDTTPAHFRIAKQAKAKRKATRLQGNRIKSKAASKIVAGLEEALDYAKQVNKEAKR